MKTEKREIIVEQFKNRKKEESEWVRKKEERAWSERGGEALYTKPNDTAKFSIILNKRDKLILKNERQARIDFFLSDREIGVFAEVYWKYF